MKYMKIKEALFINPKSFIIKNKIIEGIDNITNRPVVCLEFYIKIDGELIFLKKYMIVPENPDYDVVVNRFVYSNDINEKLLNDFYKMVMTNNESINITKNDIENIFKKYDELIKKSFNIMYFW